MFTIYMNYSIYIVIIVIFTCLYGYYLTKKESLTIKEMFTDNSTIILFDGDKLLWDKKTIDKYLIILSYFVLWWIDWLHYKR